VAATHLADASALAQLHQPRVAVRYGGLVVAGLVATCGVVDLELLARFGRDERAEVRAERRFFRRVPCDEAVLERAIAVQALLGDPLPTTVQLVVAAAAELSDLVLIHDDDAFERIAAATGQPVERVA
jgi:predicted nucleic acid-binding protein